MHVVYCVLLLCGRHGVVLADEHVVEAWCCPSCCACGTLCIVVWCCPSCCACGRGAEWCLSTINYTMAYSGTASIVFRNLYI